MSAEPPAAPGPAPIRSYHPNLDLLRSLAVLSVMMHHLSRLNFWAAGDPILMEKLGPRAAPYWTFWSPLQGGWAGVDLFFVLSGWLVGGLYWRELRETGDVRIKPFMLRRLWRTVPPYLVVLQFAWAMKFIAGKTPPTYDPGYLLFLQNYYTRMPYFQVSWSLCVEEHFYFALPVILWLARRMGSRAWMLFLSLILLPLALRLAFTPPGESFGYYTTATHLRFDGLMMGVWAAHTLYFNPAAFQRLLRIARKLLPLAGLYFFIPFALSRDWHNRIGFTLLALSTLCMILCAASSDGLWLPRLRFLWKYCSLWAYSLYLTHGHVLHVYERFILPHLKVPGLFHAVACLGLIGLCGYAFHVVIERPVIRMRDRWIPSRTNPSTSQPTAAR